jgi:hypothetical protein
MTDETPDTLLCMKLAFRVNIDRVAVNTVSTNFLTYGILCYIVSDYSDLNKVKKERLK